MAPSSSSSCREELSRIGQEGFAAIDKVYGRTTHQPTAKRSKFPYFSYRRTELVPRATYKVEDQDDHVYNYGSYGSGNRGVASKELGTAAIDSKTAARRFGGITHDVKYFAWF